MRDFLAKVITCSIKGTVSAYTVNREYFDYKIFSDSMACAKIKRTKYIRNINDNAVQRRLSENYLTRKIIAWNILDTKYSRFTVADKNRNRNV